MIAAAASVFLCAVTDDAGHRLQFEKPAQRIVSLAPDLTETLFAIGAGQHVVGVVSGSDYPAAAKKIASVGSSSGIDLEKTMLLRPDLIVTWDHHFPREIAAFQKLGIPIYVAKPVRLEDIPRTMTNLGCLAGTKKDATEQAAYFSHELAHLQKQYQLKKPVTVFYQIGDYSLITINKNSWINQVITLCGGRNVFADMTSTASEVSWEAVIAANPDVILSDTTHPSWQSRWQRFQTLSAVKRHNLFTLSPDLIDRAGPRLLEGAKQACHAIQAGR